VLERSNEERRRSSSLTVSNNNSGENGKEKRKVVSFIHLTRYQYKVLVLSASKSFQVSGLVEWSETKSCPPVHKSCIVGYFAHKETDTTNKSNNNQCPTCRQDFVPYHVLTKQIYQRILLSSLLPQAVLLVTMKGLNIELGSR
jgi:hypothetical protein